MATINEKEVKEVVAEITNEKKVEEKLYTKEEVGKIVAEALAKANVQAPAAPAPAEAQAAVVPQVQAIPAPEKKPDGWFEKASPYLKGGLKVIGVAAAVVGTYVGAKYIVGYVRGGNAAQGHSPVVVDFNQQAVA